MFALFSSLIMCVSFIVSYQHALNHDFNIIFFVGLFGVAIVWFYARRVYQAKYKRWDYEQQRYRPPVFAVDFMNVVLLLLMIWLEKLTKNFTWYDGGLVTVGSAIIIMLSLQVLLSQEVKVNQRIY